MMNNMQEEAVVAYEAIKSAAAAAAAQFPEQEQLKCPRCESNNTKFCYYNNYNLSQPRHFCKNCRRYWTKGGALRNIPVGGGSRKSSSSTSSSSSSSNKRSSSAASAAAAHPKRSAVSADQDPGPGPDPVRNFWSGVARSVPAVIPESFSSLLASNGQFGDSGSGGDHTGRVGDGFLGLQGGDWVGGGGGGTGWPDLSIYTPGSSFQLRE